MTLSPDALRIFTKALFCLSKYGEELSLQATNDTLSLSATNSAKSAYCRLKYDKQFFSRYNIARPPDQPLDYEPEVLGQLTARSLLSILKHRTVEKTVERCEFSIVDGDQQEDAGEDHDALESKLIIKLYCKHGIVKTHRVLMLTPTSMLAPSMPDAALESRLTIGPRGLKYIIEHFPMPRGAKSDPSLIWNFGDADVEVKSLESSLDPKAHGQVMTEMTISVEEFDIYDIVDLPITISFHLREFNSTIAFAESMGLPLDLHFTDAAAPLFIDIEGDCFDSLFVISTSTVPGSMASQASQRTNGQRLSRQRTTPATNATNGNARNQQPENGSPASDPQHAQARRGSSQASQASQPAYASQASIHLSQPQPSPLLSLPTRKRAHDGAPDSARGRKSMRVVQQTPVSAKGKGMMAPPLPANRHPFETPQGARGLRPPNAMQVPQTPQAARGPQMPVNRALFETPANRQPGGTQEDLGPLETQNPRMYTQTPQQSFTPILPRGLREERETLIRQSSGSGSRLFDVSQSGSVEVGRNGSTGAPHSVPNGALRRDESLGDSQYQFLNADDHSFDDHEQSLIAQDQSFDPSLDFAQRQSETAFVDEADEEVASSQQDETPEEPLFLPGPSQFPSSQPQFPSSRSQFPSSRPSRRPNKANETRLANETSGEPLFLPGPSQLASSQAHAPPSQPAARASQITTNDPEALRQVESLTQEELEAMFDMRDIDLELEDDDRTWDDGMRGGRKANGGRGRVEGGRSGRLVAERSTTALSRTPSSASNDRPRTPYRSYPTDETQMPPTQSSRDGDESGAFHPLFED
ncbi:uncharacterized protein SCHCODRAFT_02632118 [Schizophyllum commune H4-8]|nr:uncharacterized protein SCHCODRAFT_02632118 [Schizophyllum commune H4-8]KAI5890530.1 hypothetical protein SCHCODRAFT_02632118 [Schizophyllum commune H4-8]